jgi:hypothetical protein
LPPPNQFFKFFIIINPLCLLKMEIEEEGNETTVHHTIKNYGKLRGSMGITNSINETCK